MSQTMIPDTRKKLIKSDIAATNRDTCFLFHDEPFCLRRALRKFTVDRFFNNVKGRI